MALVGAIAAVGLGAFLFAEVSPRAFGRSYYDVLAPLAAPFTVGLRTVLGPVATALVLVANAVTPGSGSATGPSTPRPSCVTSSTSPRRTSSSRTTNGT